MALNIPYQGKDYFLFPCLKILLGHRNRWTRRNHHKPSCGVCSSWEGRETASVSHLPLSPLCSQWPLSGIHSIMMEKSSQPGDCHGCTPAPFHWIYLYVQSCCVRSSWEGRYTFPISILSLYVLCGYTPELMWYVSNCIFFWPQSHLSVIFDN